MAHPIVHVAHSHDLAALRALYDRRWERLSVADALESCSFKKGDVIIKQGDDGDDFYLIIEGECEVRVLVLLCSTLFCSALVLLWCTSPLLNFTYFHFARVHTHTHTHTQPHHNHTHTSGYMPTTLHSARPHMRARAHTHTHTHTHTPGCRSQRRLTGRRPL